MKILGIIAEYNPFHKGHDYHIGEAKRLIAPDYTVVCMSGNFVQRGEPALLDKWTRAELAVRGGEARADVVFELPTMFACNRAEIFAKGAVELLAGVGVTDISFGCEAENFGEIEEIALLMLHEKQKLSMVVRNRMLEGISYAAATEAAICEMLGKGVSGILRGSNNILAIEYMKNIVSLRERGVHINPVPVLRKGAAIDEVNEDLGFAGATQIRRFIGEGKLSEIATYVPDAVYAELGDVRGSVEPPIESSTEVPIEKRIARAEEKAFEIVRAEIVRKKAEELAEIYCVGGGLEYKLKKEIVGASSMDSLIQSVVSKRYTAASVKRILMYILLGAKDEDFSGSPLYARLLAAGRRGRAYLKYIKRNEDTSIPLITNINSVDFRSGYLEMDLLAADMYNILFERDLYSYSDRVLKPYIEEL